MSVPVVGLSQRDFKAARRKTKRALIPVGSLEQHGDHLPVSTDSLIAEYIARSAADQIGGFVLPVISYGVSFEHKPMFNLSLRNSTLSTMIFDACVSLAENGIRDIVILNGHYGNMSALKYLARHLNKKLPKEVKVKTIHYWQMMKNEFDHAGEVETSLVLAIAPELVRMDRAFPNSKKVSRSRTRYRSIANAPGSFPKITGNGVWGDPRKATASKGEKWIKEIVAGTAKTITGLC